MRLDNELQLMLVNTVRKKVLALLGCALLWKVQ